MKKAMNRLRFGNLKVVSGWLHQHLGMAELLQYSR